MRSTLSDCLTVGGQLLATVIAQPVTFTRSLFVPRVLSTWIHGAQTSQQVKLDSPPGFAHSSRRLHPNPRIRTPNNGPGGDQNGEPSADPAPEESPAAPAQPADEGRIPPMGKGGHPSYSRALKAPDVDR